MCFGPPQQLCLDNHPATGEVFFGSFAIQGLAQTTLVHIGTNLMFRLQKMCESANTMSRVANREVARRVHMSDDLNLGWLIHYVFGHRMPKPCKAMGNLKSDTLSLIHHMMLWIVIWICWISITAAPPKYYHVLLLSSKYSKRSHKVLQRITSSHYQELQRMDLMQPATCFSQIRCPSER